MPLRPTVSAGILTVLFAFLLTPGLSAQQAGERFRIVIPDMMPLEGADDDFGKRAAEHLRKLMATLPTHETLTRDEVEDSMDRFDLDWEDMNCARTQQLASAIDARVALCAEYVPTADGSMEVRAAFWDIASAESFEVSPTVVQEDAVAEAARHVFEEFDLYTQQVRAANFCADYARSRQWDDAVRNCDRAIELNPDALGARYHRARVLFETDRNSQALAELERILERDPIHQGALQLAGYVAGTEGWTDRAVSYYTRYLELDPGNAAVRMRVAYDLAQAGDPEGALRLIQVGLDTDPDNIDLWEQYGGYAFTLGQRLAEAASPEDDSGSLTPEARRYYGEAVEAYRRVFEVRGVETPARHLRSIVLGHIRMDELPMAVSVASEAVEIHPDDPTIWSVYADALYQSDQLGEALSALERVRELDPGYRNLDLRQGKWLIEGGELQAAVDLLERVAEAEPARADDAARVILTDAYAKGIQRQDYAYAARVTGAASELPNLGDSMRHQLNFWHAYSLFRVAVEEQEPRTLETAQSTLPTFRRVLELLGDVGDYPSTVNVTLSELVDNVNTFIEIQEAIIKRGR